MIRFVEFLENSRESVAMKANSWIERHPVNILDIKYTSRSDGHGQGCRSLLIMYEKEEETKMGSEKLTPDEILYKRDDIWKVLDRFAGYLDEDMIERIKITIKRDCTPVYFYDQGALETSEET